MPFSFASLTAPLTQHERDRKTVTYMVIAAYGLIAQIVARLHDLCTVEYSPASLLLLAQFHAIRPFQYRVLVPAIVHFLGRVTHADSYQYEALYGYIELAATFATFVAFRAYLRTFFNEALATVFSFSIAIPMLLIHTVWGSMKYPTDTPQILLFTLCLLYLRTQNWRVFYPVVAVSMFNRESTVLIVVAMAVTMFDQLPKRTLTAHLIATTVLCVGVKLFVNHLFAHNPGGVMENQMPLNLYLLGQLAHFQPTVLWTAVSLSMVPAFLWLGRRFIDNFALRVLVLVPVYAVVMFFVGILDETRAYNEMLPVLLPPLLMVFWQLLEQTKSGEVDEPLEEINFGTQTGEAAQQPIRQAA